MQQKIHDIPIIQEHVAALAYILVFGGFVYFMTMMYGDDGGEAEDQEEFDGMNSDATPPIVGHK